MAGRLRYIGHCLVVIFLLQSSYIQPFLLRLSGEFIRFISVYPDKVSQALALSSVARYY